MKSYILIILFFLISSFCKAQVVDVAPSGNENIRAVEGGGERVTIDTKTPLNELINRLDKPWKFIETGKAYWIGYTDDMYSIANYKDKAIQSLINFIDTSKNKYARIGGLYTLHLIGINSTIVGRFIEDFSNSKARTALLRYLNEKDLNRTVTLLLMRDPWLSDLPELIKCLETENKDGSNILNALYRYTFEGKPINQKITDTIFAKEFKVATPGYADVETYALIKFQQELGESFLVDKDITETEKWKKCKTNSSVNNAPEQILSFDFLALSDSMFSYCGSDTPVTYIYRNHQVEVIGTRKCRQVWLDWWSGLSAKDKEKFYSFVHLPITERFKKNN